MTHYSVEFEEEHRPVGIRYHRYSVDAGEAREWAEDNGLSPDEDGRGWEEWSEEERYAVAERIAESRYNAARGGHW